MPIIEITNFAAGIQSSSGYTRAKDVAAEEMRNLIIDRQGRLARRGGSQRPLATTEEAGLVTALYRPLVHTENASYRIRNLIITEISGDPIRYWHASGAAFSTVSTTNYVYGMAEPFVQGVFFKERFFIGRPTRHWLEITDVPPTVYNLGAAAPADPTLAVNNNGANDLTASLWYGVAYTYYNTTYTIETAPSTQVAIQTTAANRTVRATLTRTTDTQWNRIRVYRTAGYDSQAAAQSATVQLVGAYAAANTAGTDNVDISGTNWDAPVGTGFASYTIGAVNTTTDHVVHPLQIAPGPTYAWHFVAVYANRLWTGTRPRTIRYSKRTTSDTFPDWYPSDHTFDVREEDEVLTGLMRVPSGDGLLIFTNKTVYVMRGDSRETIDISRKLSAPGCGYPRTIAATNERVYYLATDKQIWATDGNQAIVVSQPVQTFINAIHPHWEWIPCAGIFRNQYFLAYPSGPLVSSSANTTAGGIGAGGTLFTGDWRQNITDGTAWDLSAVKVGMWLHLRHSTGAYVHNRGIGIITAVNDSTDTVTWEAMSNTGSSGYIYDVVTNNRILIYDAVYRNWRMYDEPDVNAFLYWPSPYDQGQFFAALSDGGFVDEIETSDTTDTGGTAITSSWKSNWFTLPSKGIVRGIYVFQATGSSLTISVYVDQSSTATQTVTGFTPSAANQYRTGVFAYGRQVQIEISGSAINTIDRIWIEWEPYNTQKGGV